MKCRAGKSDWEITIKSLCSLYIGCSSVSTSKKAGVGSLEDPVVLLLKINTHTHTHQFVENGKCWAHETFLLTTDFQSGRRQPTLSSSAYWPVCVSNPLRVISAQHYSVTVSGCCVCVSEECEGRGLWSYAFHGSDEASPAALCLNCGSVGREHPNHPLAVGDFR